MVEAKVLNIKLALVTKTTAEWATETTVPAKGTPLVEQTTDGKMKLKIGDGTNTFASLPYVASEVNTDSLMAAIANTYIASSKIGQPDGVAGLDGTGKVPAAYLPSFVDDVVEVATINDAPETGETGKIYVDLATGKCHRWSGTAYIEISSSDIVTASETNGCIKVNGVDIQVYVPDTIDSSLSNTSEKPVQNKVVTAALANCIQTTDSLVLNCTL